MDVGRFGSGLCSGLGSDLTRLWEDAALHSVLGAVLDSVLDSVLDMVLDSVLDSVLI